MAGIGFELRKILQKDSLSAIAQAHFLGGVIVLGPFLCSVVCLAALNLTSAPYATFATRQVFAAAAVYVFGSSLIFTGPLQVVLTRYLADKVYRGESDSLIESLFPVLLVTIVILDLIALPMLALLDVSSISKLAILSLHSVIGCLWMVVVFVRAAHGHRALAIAFLIGSAAALFLALSLVQPLQLDGLLIGYTAGHAILLVLLIRQLLAEFGYPSRWDWAVLGYVKLFPKLLLIGLFQNLGIWIDKLVFWTSDLSIVTDRFVTAPKYDSSTFLAYLTALPAFVVFFIRVETDFHDRFHGYYDEIFFRGSYDAIAASARSLREGLISALFDILKVQGLVSLLAVFFAVEILQGIGLPVSQVGMLRFGIVGSFFMAFMLFAIVILLYLDRQSEVLQAVAVFFSTNLGLSLLTVHVGYQFYGLGFALASLLGLLTALFHLANQLYNLEYMTFGMMPVMGQKRGRRSLRVRRGGLYGAARKLAQPGVRSE